MKKERENIEKWKEDYEYKIKKLKEELEVAHIVKEQNLEDKFNYILGWKLWSHKGLFKPEINCVLIDNLQTFGFITYLYFHIF